MLKPVVLRNTDTCHYILPTTPENHIIEERRGVSSRDTLHRKKA